MAKKNNPGDPRPYVRVAVDLPLHPKLAEIDSPSAGWTYVVSLCYCGQSLTDGHFPVTAVLRLAGTTKKIGDALVAQGLWHLRGHQCQACDQPRPGQAVIHDYLRHQVTADERRDLSDKRREAGRAGAAARWGDKNMASAMADDMPSSTANGRQPYSKSMAEESREEKISSSSSSTRNRFARLGADDDETTRALELIKAECNPTALGPYIRRLDENGDLTSWLERVRHNRHGRAAYDGPTHQFQPDQSGEYCTECQLPAAHIRHTTPHLRAVGDDR
jgi:hypothetical protein